MAKCLVKSSTQADRATFIQFIFIAIAQQPDTKDLHMDPEKLKSLMAEADSPPPAAAPPSTAPGTH
jgi:hypothetical protein